MFPRILSLRLVFGLMRSMRREPDKWSAIAINTWQRKTRGDKEVFEVVIDAKRRWFRCRTCDMAHLLVRDGQGHWEVPLGIVAAFLLRRAAWRLAARKARSL